MPQFTPYISELLYRGPGSGDFVEVALDNGADPSVVQVVVYNNNGTIRSTNSLGATPDDTVAGTDVYTVQAAIHRLGAVALVVDGTVVSFVSFDAAVTASEGPATGLTSTQIGTTARGDSLESTDMGASYFVETSPNPGTIACFLAGTLVKTPGGPRPIETLQAGDPVLTRDHGAQPVAWAGRRALARAETLRHALHPVRISAHAFGRGRPARDVLVSPAHRLLVTGARLEVLFGASEVLVAARHLVGLEGVTIARDIPAPVYHHLMFAHHELISTHGLISESFHPMAQGIAGFDIEARRELLTLFPGLALHPDLYGATARPCLRGYEAPLAAVTLGRAA